jgi:hypothetical protein
VGQLVCALHGGDASMAKAKENYSADEIAFLSVSMDRSTIAWQNRCANFQVIA